MFLELTFLDGYRGIPVWAQVEVDFAGARWTLQEGDALDFLGFNKDGLLEAKSGELWLFGMHRKPKDRALVLKGAPMNEDDASRHTGPGRIEGHVSMGYSKSKIEWHAPALAPIRRKILALCAGILPPYPKLLTPGESPMTKISTNVLPVVPGETNCYAFPGWIAKQLGSSAVVRIIGMFPDVKSGKLKEQTVALSLTKGIMALEKFASDPSIGAWVPFNGKNRPNPGDFYVLSSDAQGVKIAHVGVIVDATGETWITADSGQGDEKWEPDKADATKKVKKWAKGMAAGYRRRKFDNGVVTGEFGRTAYLKGWVDIDHPVLFPTEATPRLS